MVTIFPFFIFHFRNFSALPLSLNANESKNENEKTYGTYLKSNQMMCNNFNIIRMRIDHSKTLSWPLVSLLWLLSWGQQIMLSVRLSRYSESHVQSAESGVRNPDQTCARSGGKKAECLRKTCIKRLCHGNPDFGTQDTRNTQDMQRVRVAGQ